MNNDVKNDTTYTIGKAGIKWGVEEKEQWMNQQRVQRSYFTDVVSQIENLVNDYAVEQYGKLNYKNKDYPLYAIKTSNWLADKPAVLITGGVHGYETSGVQGAIRFLQASAQRFKTDFNFVVLPCISPWGYETINRWNPLAVDPNRSFYDNSPAAESAAVMNYLISQGLDFVAHIDLHETTDTDNSEFRPALAARDAIVQKNWNIPDGFYLVGDTTKPQDKFQQAIIESVKKVTHIAPADNENKLIGVPLAQFGVINYAARELGLCMGLTEAPYVTTTEVYPDSELVDDENCILAQVAVIEGALEYISQQ